MTAKIKLKPCPFCDGKAVYKDFKRFQLHNYEDMRGVGCTKCSCKLMFFRDKTTEREAINAWNRRA